MSDLVSVKRDAFIKSEAVFSARAIGVILSAGLLRNTAYPEHAAKQLRALVDDWEASDPAPKTAVEQADIDFVRKSIQL